MHVVLVYVRKKNWNNRDVSMTMTTMTTMIYIIKKGEVKLLNK